MDEVTNTQAAPPPDTGRVPVGVITTTTDLPQETAPLPAIEPARYATNVGLVSEMNAKLADLRAFISRIEGDVVHGIGSDLHEAKERLAQAESWVLRHLGLR